jgi:hypothetical protein
MKVAARGMLLFLTPAYFGYSNDGWYSTIEANGVRKMEQYGRYIGTRYAACRNIIWVIGGDRTPPETKTGDALARGILAGQPGALLTAHANSEAEVDRIWGKYPWLSINSLFTYKAVWPRAVALYHRSSKPFFLIESAYENDGFNAQTPTRMRTQAYQAILAGSTGELFGNNPIWHFDGPGCCSSTQFPTTWKRALGLEGSKSMTVLGKVFADYAWHTLKPDLDARFVTAGLSSGLDRVAAAVAADRSFAMAFVPSARRIRLNINRLRGPVNIVWVDPTNGARRPAATSVRGRLTLVTPSRNAKGGGDWLLIAEGRRVASK